MPKSVKCAVDSLAAAAAVVTGAPETPVLNGTLVADEGAVPLMVEATLPELAPVLATVDGCIEVEVEGVVPFPQTLGTACITQQSVFVSPPRICEREPTLSRSIVDESEGRWDQYSRKQKLETQHDVKE
jgi:hypothetical protein